MMELWSPQTLSVSDLACNKSPKSIMGFPSSRTDSGNETDCHMFNKSLSMGDIQDSSRSDSQGGMQPPRTQQGGYKGFVSRVRDSMRRRKNKDGNRRKKFIKNHDESQSCDSSISNIPSNEITDSTTSGTYILHNVSLNEKPNYIPKSEMDIEPGAEISSARKGPYNSCSTDSGYTLRLKSADSGYTLSPIYCQNINNGQLNRSKSPFSPSGGETSADNLSTVSSFVSSRTVPSIFNTPYVSSESSRTIFNTPCGYRDNSTQRISTPMTDASSLYQSALEFPGEAQSRHVNDRNRGTETTDSIQGTLKRTTNNDTDFLKPCIQGRNSTALSIQDSNSSCSSIAKMSFHSDSSCSKRDSNCSKMDSMCSKRDSTCSKMESMYSKMDSTYSNKDINRSKMHVNCSKMDSNSSKMDSNCSKMSCDTASSREMSTGSGHKNFDVPCKSENGPQPPLNVDAG